MEGGSLNSPEPFEIALKYLKYLALHNIEDDPNIQYIYILYISNIYIYIYCISIYSMSTMAFESHLQYPSDLTCAVPMFLGGTRRTWFPEGRAHFPPMVWLNGWLASGKHTFQNNG